MSNAESAVTAVQFSDLGAAERWFELIGEAYTPDVSWDDLKSTLIARGGASVGSDSAEAFVKHAESLSGDPLDTFRDIAADTSWAFGTYAAAQAAGGEGDGGAAYDPAAWDAFLAENGPAWDGTEEQWETFVNWFVYQAGEAGVAAPAREFIDYAAAQPDKVAVFAAYGITIAAPARVPAAEYDPETWNAFLVENGPRWDGTEEQWETFVNWFVYQAGESRVATAAQGFIDYVAAQPDKVAAFAAYGVTIAAPAAPEQAELPAVSEQVLEVIGDSGLQDVLAAAPELKDLSPEELDAVLREALAEMGETVGAGSGAESEEG